MLAIGIIVMDGMILMGAANLLTEVDARHNSAQGPNYELVRIERY